MGLAEKYTKSPEALREFQAGRLAMEVTELICQVMDDAGVTRAELALRLGKSRPYISKLLDGSTNMTVKTIADVFAALGRSVRVVDRPLSVYTPQLLVTESGSDSDQVSEDTFRHSKETEITVDIHPQLTQD